MPPVQHQGGGGGPGRQETEAQRLDRNFNELLQELRVVQTGVQLLFAFLLTLAFTERFARAATYQEAVYVVTLLLTVMASALLIAPAAYHRGRFRQGVKDAVVQRSHRMARAGLATLALAISGAMLLVLSVVVPLGWAVTLAGAGLAVLWSLWFVLPAVEK